MKEVVRVRRDAGDEWLRARCLLRGRAAYWTWEEPGQDVARVMCRDDGSMFEGFVATDGARLHGCIAETARHGWAVCGGTEDGEARARVRGPLPFPRPSILLAELWAVRQCLRWATGPMQLGVDNLTVFKGLKRGRAWSTQAQRPFAHIWADIWDALDDIGWDPSRGGGPGEVHKVKAHLDLTAIHGLHGTARTLHLLNRTADEDAKAGAGYWDASGWQAEAMKADRRMLRDIGRYLGMWIAMAKTKGVVWCDRAEKRKPTEQVQLKWARAQKLAQNPHIPVIIGRIMHCKTCWRAVHCIKGAKRFMQEECDGGGLAAVLRAGAGVVHHDMSGHVRPSDVNGHMLMQCGRYLYCDKCGSFLSKAVRKGYVSGLTIECRGLNNFGAKAARDRLRKGLQPRDSTELGATLGPV